MIIKPFEKLTKDELWEIRQGIILNSMFYHDYQLPLPKGRGLLNEQ